MDLGSQKIYSVVHDDWPPHVYAIKQQFFSLSFPFVLYRVITSTEREKKIEPSTDDIDGFALVCESDKTILMNYVLIN